MKTISVPLSVEAMRRLDYGETRPGDVEELELDNHQFEFIWKSGLFDELNNQLGVIIDDYEDESIKDVQKLKIAFDIVKSIKDKIGQTLIIDEIERLFRLAIEKQTGIFFFF